MGIFDFFKKNKNIQDSNGLNEIYYNSGKGDIKERYYMKNGKKEGIYKSYNKPYIEPLIKQNYGSTLCEVGNYINGKKEGVWRFYTHPENLFRGIAYSEGNYINGEKEGNWKDYDLAENIKPKSSSFQVFGKVREDIQQELLKKKREFKLFMIIQKRAPEDFITKRQEMQTLKDVIKKNIKTDTDLHVEYVGMRLLFTIIIVDDEIEEFESELLRSFLHQRGLIEKNESWASIAETDSWKEFSNLCENDPTYMNRMIDLMSNQHKHDLVTVIIRMGFHGSRDKKEAEMAMVIAERLGIKEMQFLEMMQSVADSLK